MTLYHTIGSWAIALEPFLNWQGTKDIDISAKVLKETDLDSLTAHHMVSFKRNTKVVQCMLESGPEITGPENAVPSDASQSY